MIAINPNIPRVERQPPAAFRPFVVESSRRGPESPEQLSYGWFDTITVYGGTRGATSYVWKRDGVVVPGASTDRLTFTITNQTAGDYSVTAIGPGGQTESFAAMVISPLGAMPEAPVFVQHPEPITIAVGTTGTLRAKATGSPAPFYTWRKDGVTIPGFDTDLLDYYLINNAKFSDAGLYECVARNSMGTVVSRAALVTIVAPPPPTVVTHPTSKTALVGDLVSLTAFGSSPPSPTYQWRKDGTPISGATGSALTWNKVALTNAGRRRGRTRAANLSRSATRVFLEGRGCADSVHHRYQ